MALEEVTLSRDVTAIVIPHGFPIALPAGSRVYILQSLGGDYTVETDRGQLARVAASDADALGKESTAAPRGAVASAGAAGPAGAAAPAKPLEELVWDELRTCYDPEIPANIVDLGLIYDCRIAPVAEGALRVDVKLTLTAPGCGMGGVLAADIERKLLQLPGVSLVNVELVLDPPWNPGMMSEAARLELGML